MVEKLYSMFSECGMVTTDSRQCPEGSMFIALKGDNFNGNAFAAKALEAGCRYAVIDEPEYMKPNDSRYMLVPNGLQALQQLARQHRRQLGVPVIGITGTNGKTTTKELIAAVLKQRYNILYTQGNLNNSIGVPLTLLRLNSQHQLAIIEMGASHPGDIKELVEVAEPDYGLITNVGKAHLQGFGSFEGVIKTKGELYDYLRAHKPGSTIFIDHENPYLNAMTHGLNTVEYGTSQGLYVNGQALPDHAQMVFQWQHKGDESLHTVHTKLIGNYNLPNALAAATIGTYFDVPAQCIDEALEAYMPQNNRSQLIKTQRNTLIVDAYNANPSSMHAAIDNFYNLKAENKMLILGDMKELGADSETLHAEVVALLQSKGFDNVILVGAEFAKVAQDYPTYPHVEALAEALQKQTPCGHCILIKGSNSTRLFTLPAVL